MDLTTALRIDAGAVVVFTGAGGKTTAMLRLGRELAAAGLRVLATTTTRLGIDQLQLFPGHLVDPTRLDIVNMLARVRFLFVARELDGAEGKALGFGSEQIASFRDWADVILVEGDGSRGLPIKAPGPGEPVIPPDATHVVCCAHVAALGQALGPATVHRPEIFARLTGLASGEIITPAIFARLLLHPDGPARGAPAGAERHILLNGVDGRGSGDWGLEMALPAPGPDLQSSISNLQSLSLRLAASPEISSVLLAQVAHESPVITSYGKVAAVVLAAGGSSRFGSPKQLLDWHGQPLLRHVVMQVLAAPVSEIIVVLGAYFEEITPALAGLPVTLVYNRDWEQGQSASVRVGLRACQRHTRGALFILGDQPHLPTPLLRQLVETHGQSLAPIAAPQYGGRRGNPVLFDQQCFPELLRIEGDAGGRSLFERYRSRIAWIEAGAEILADIDRPEDVGKR